MRTILTTSQERRPKGEINSLSTIGVAVVEPLSPYQDRLPRCLVTRLPRVIVNEEDFLRHSTYSASCQRHRKTRSGSVGSLMPRGSNPPCCVSLIQEDRQQSDTSLLELS